MTRHHVGAWLSALAFVWSLLLTQAFESDDLRVLFLVNGVASAWLAFAFAGLARDYAQAHKEDRT